MSQTKIPVILESESDYWKYIESLNGKGLTNLMTRGRHILGHYAEAKKNINSDPDYYKKLNLKK